MVFAPGRKHEETAPERRHHERIALADVARSFVCRLRTSSMPIIRPHPRTSPMMRCRSRQLLEPPQEKVPHVGGILHQAVAAPA